MYDTEISTRGALLAADGMVGAGAARRPRSNGAVVATAAAQGAVHNPHALPMYKANLEQERAWGRQRRDQARKDPLRSRRPQLPGSGEGGAVDEGKASGIRNAYSSSFTQHFMQNRVSQAGPTLREQDPREVLLSYNGASSGAQFTGRAYSATQPRTLLASKTAEQEAADAALEQQEEYG